MSLLAITKTRKKMWATGCGPSAIRMAKASMPHHASPEDSHRGVRQRVASRGQRVEEDRADQGSGAPSGNGHRPHVLGAEAHEGHPDEAEQRQRPVPASPHRRVELTQRDDHHQDHEDREPPASEDEAAQEETEDHDRRADTHGQVGARRLFRCLVGLLRVRLGPRHVAEADQAGVDTREARGHRLLLPFGGGGALDLLGETLSTPGWCPSGTPRR